MKPAKNGIAPLILLAFVGIGIIIAIAGSIFLYYFLRSIAIGLVGVIAIIAGIILKVLDALDEGFELSNKTFYFLIILGVIMLLAQYMLNAGVI